MRNVPLSPERVSELRHNLRTPVNLIVGYCEMLLEDTREADPRERLEEALSAVREVLDRINRSLPAARLTVSPEDVEALYASLVGPQARIVAAMTALLAAPADESFLKDVRKIRDAAERLLQVEPPLTSHETSRLVDEPTLVRERADVPLPAAPEPPAEAARRALVLVVDDVEENRDVLARRLVREGHEVECAENGKVALERVRERAFDLILLDIMMPEVDGFAVLESLKSAPATRDIPVIMISALDDLTSVARCIEQGAEDHLPKPFEPVLLRARIGASLEKKWLRDREIEYLAQVKQVTDAASSVDAGTYASGALASVAIRSDELGHLARVFDSMAASVRTREERLKSQVTALRAEIGEAQKSASGATVQDASFIPGQHLADRYEILEVLGKGAMGTVYKAYDRKLSEVVAVKRLRSELLANPAVLDRFKTEVVLARRITHPNVVRTHDFGESMGIYFLTMEYVEGITARTLIDTRGKLAVSSVLAIGSQLAQSLDVAHAQGVIHRDIKPQNLLLDREGVLKVMDFGVSRLTERTGEKTEAGLIIGTPAYMAPEQLLSKDVDARIDLYAAGVVLYECLTGKLPFDAASPIALITKVLHAEPAPVAALNPEVSPALSSLIARLLSKQPDDRPGSAGELANLLSQV